jgi:4-hydroxybenzoyl-CoA thioesterase
MLTLAVTAIGRRSIGIEIVGHCNGETRFRAKQVLVTTSLESGRSIDIPTDIATALAMFAPQPELSEAQRS